MTANKTKWVSLGDYIEEVRIYNSSNKYGEDLCVGVNIDKELRTMRGNLNNKDFSTFHIVPPLHFVYNPRGSRKLGLGFNNTSQYFITTFNNTVFRIQEGKEQGLLPDYLFMLLSRKEFDRYAEMLSWGSSTEVFSWQTLCAIQIPLPSIDVQESLVATYKGLKGLAEDNEVLIEPLTKVCEAFIVDCKKKYKEVPLGDYIELCDETNSEGKYTVSDVKGISTAKEFIEDKS